MCTHAQTWGHLSNKNIFFTILVGQHILLQRPNVSTCETKVLVLTKKVNLQSNFLQFITQEVVTTHTDVNGSEKWQTM